jgi:hypothetical protein
MTSNRKPLRWAASVGTIAAGVFLQGLLAAATGAEPPRPTAASTPPVGANVALGCRYTLSPEPNYAHCTDPGDVTQLTDGKTTREYFWTQKGTVGWSGCPFAVITLDLGQVQPIQGVKFNTAAGVAGVTWPAFIQINVSDDGQSYRDIGDLVGIDRKLHGELPKQYALRQLVASNLQTRARFVRFVIASSSGGGYIFVDEIEIHRGPDALLSRDPGGKPANSPEQLFREHRFHDAMKQRFTKDVDSLGKVIAAAKISDESLRGIMRRRLNVIAKRLEEETDADDCAGDKSFRAVLPLGAAHARLFALQADLWNACGRPRMSVSTPVAWDPVDPFAEPGPTAAPVVVHTMRGEYRAAALNLYNATGATMNIRLRFEGLPGGSTPNFATVHEVAWTDTIEGRPVASALPEATKKNGAWNLAVLPGLARQVWFTFHVTDTPPGRYEGKIVVGNEAVGDLSVPLRLEVWPFDFPKQTTLLVGGWSYTDGDGSYGVTKQNRPAFLKHLQERFVNSPWATGAVLSAQTTDGATPQVKLDTQRFDDWLAQWPSARQYMVFASVGDSFAGKKAGTPEFKRCVGAWISAWVRHLQSKGVAPERFSLLLVDEPREGIDIAPLVAWSQAIRAAEPKVQLWLDPIYVEPAKAPPSVFETADVLCPNRPMWLRQGKPFADFFLARQAQGRTLHFYSCDGPAHLLDPYSYYRMQAWHAWQIGAKASYFWAFGDTSGSPSWNPYLVTAGGYCPFFLDDDSVTAGKQMEAIRESVEDYEYFVMLRKAVDKAKASGAAGPATAQAESLLSTAADEVLAGIHNAELRWHTPQQRTKADSTRVRLLEAMRSLATPSPIEAK